MHNDQKTGSFFNFIHPDHECLPRTVRVLFNAAAVAMFFAPVVIASASCLGIVLGLSRLQDALPLLAQGLALTVIAMIKGNTVALTGLLVTAAYCERELFAQFIRDDLYDTIKKDVMPRFH
jgi:hypothetical protein